MSKQELNKELAEFADLEVCFDQYNKEYFGKDHSGRYVQFVVLNFTQSLDACFKWLVPKYISKVCKLPMGLTSIMSIYAFLFAEWLKFMKEGLEPALALCKAIEKLIDSEQK